MKKRIIIRRNGVRICRLLPIKQRAIDSALLNLMPDYRQSNGSFLSRVFTKLKENTAPKQRVIISASRQINAGTSSDTNKIIANIAKTLEAINNLRQRGTVDLIKRHPSIYSLPVGFQKPNIKEECAFESSFFKFDINIIATLPENLSEWPEIKQHGKNQIPRAGFLLFYLLSNDFWNLKTEMQKIIQLKYTDEYAEVTRRFPFLYKHFKQVNDQLQEATTHITDIFRKLDQNNEQLRKLEKVVSWKDWLELFLLQEEVIALKVIIGINDQSSKPLIAWPTAAVSIGRPMRIRTRRGIVRINNKRVNKNIDVENISTFYGKMKRMNNTEWKPTKEDAQNSIFFINKFI